MPRSSVVLAALTLLVASCGGMTSRSSRPDPEQPTSCATTEPCAFPPAQPSGAQNVRPRPGMADLRPVPFESATPEGDGITVRVLWWSGVEPCYVLDHVAVVESAASVTITLFEGHDPAAQDLACIELAVQKSTRIELDHPLGSREVVDGAQATPGRSATFPEPRGGGPL
ncbi:MAG: hypothetical protein ABR592_04055 [Nitriliruptorales bacterium]